MGKTFVVLNATAKVSLLNKHFKLPQMYKLLSTGRKGFTMNMLARSLPRKVSPSKTCYPATF